LGRRSAPPQGRLTGFNPVWFGDALFFSTVQLLTVSSSGPRAWRPL